VVHEKTILTEYSRIYPQKNIQHVPHGNYIDVYGPRIERENTVASQNLRKSFGFSESDIVLASFGSISPYKLNEKIIEVIVLAQKINSRLKLLVVGKGKQQYVEKLSAAIPANSGIVIKNQFIPDADLPLFLSIADYSVFYYDQSEMTSGGITLSLSYGVPVITRNIPASELVRPQNGYVFSNEKDFLEILKKIQKDSIPTSPNDIIKSVQKNDWANSAERLKQIYESLFLKDTPTHS
jgi:glycosyltransferase involved in cell wall biosynthesis